MANVDIDKLELPQLRDHMAEVEAKIKEKERDAERAFKAEVAELAKKRGVVLGSVFGGGMKVSKAGGARSAVAPKYRDTKDDTLTWSGRGKPPKWMQAHLDGGKKREDFLIAS